MNLIVVALYMQFWLCNDLYDWGRLFG